MTRRKFVLMGSMVVAAARSSLGEEEGEAKASKGEATVRIGIVTDLHYADTPAYATGHGVSVDWDGKGLDCHILRTAWIPGAEVEKTATVAIEGVNLSMKDLGALKDGAEAAAMLREVQGTEPDEVRGWRERAGPLVGVTRDLRMALRGHDRGSGRRLSAPINNW